MQGVRTFPSEANMILVRVPDSKRAFEGMKARGVLVKNIGAALATRCWPTACASPWAPRKRTPR